MAEETFKKWLNFVCPSTLFLQAQSQIGIFSLERTTTKKAMNTSYLDTMQTECMHFNPYFNMHSVYIKTHIIKSCGPRKLSALKQSEYIEKKNKVKIFTHLQLHDVSSK